VLLFDFLRDLSYLFLSLTPSRLCGSSYSPLLQRPRSIFSPPVEPRRSGNFLSSLSQVSDRVEEERPVCAKSLPFPFFFRCSLPFSLLPFPSVNFPPVSFWESFSPFLSFFFLLLISLVHLRHLGGPFSSKTRSFYDPCWTLLILWFLPPLAFFLP